MRIQIIGTGSMWTKYNSACYLIDDEIMIDFPNGACKYLYRLNILPNTINFILITHFHGDHYFDLPFYILNKSKSNNKDIFIYCTKEGKRKIDKIGNLAFPNSYKKACYDLKLNYSFEKKIKICNYNIDKLLVDHGRMKPAFGYVFKTEKLYVGFTGDTALCKTVETMASKCSYLFCDCMLETGNNKHQGIDNLKYLSSKYPNCKFVVSHLNDITRKKLEDLNINNIIVPSDYDVFNIK